MPKRVLLSWSSGKDSAWVLHLLRQQPDVEVVGLLTTFNEAAGRVAMHAVRRELVEAQAVVAGLPHRPVIRDRGRAAVPLVVFGRPDALARPAHAGGRTARCSDVR